VSSIRGWTRARAQLAAWPAFREVSDHIHDESYFANTAPVRALQEDCTYIRSRSAFFCIPRAEPERSAHPLQGRVN